MKAIKQFKFTSSELLHILVSHIQTAGHPETKNTLEVRLVCDGDVINTRGVEGEKCFVTVEVPVA